MQDASKGDLELTFPRKYLHKLEDYRRKHIETPQKPRVPRPERPKVFSSRCKQAIYHADKTYCGILKELIEGSLCKACPCHEPEPIDYSLFRREWKKRMKCPNNACKHSTVVENKEGNFDYCTECGTIIYRHKK